MIRALAALIIGCPLLSACANAQSPALAGEASLDPCRTERTAIYRPPLRPGESGRVVHPNVGRECEGAGASDRAAAPDGISVQSFDDDASQQSLRLDLVALERIGGEALCRFHPIRPSSLAAHRGSAIARVECRDSEGHREASVLEVSPQGVRSTPIDHLEEVRLGTVSVCPNGDILAESVDGYAVIESGSGRLISNSTNLDRPSNSELETHSLLTVNPFTGAVLRIWRSGHLKLTSCDGARWTRVSDLPQRAIREHQWLGPDALLIDLYPAPAEQGSDRDPTEVLLLTPSSGRLEPYALVERPPSGGRYLRSLNRDLHLAWTGSRAEVQNSHGIVLSGSAGPVESPYCWAWPSERVFFCVERDAVSVMSADRNLHAFFWQVLDQNILSDFIHYSSFYFFDSQLLAVGPYTVALFDVTARQDAR